MEPISLSIIYQACQIGDIETIKKFLNSDGFSHDFIARKDVMLMHSIKNERLELINFLLKNFKNDKNVIKMASTFAISINNLKVFKSIAESFSTDEYFVENLENGHILSIATKVGNLDLVKYILETDYLNKYIHIHLIQNSIFKEAIESNHLDVLRYFIFDFNINLTPTIAKLIEFHPNIESMFELRHINKDLKDKLNKNNNTNRKLKV